MADQTKMYRNSAEKQAAYRRRLNSKQSEEQEKATAWELIRDAATRAGLLKGGESHTEAASILRSRTTLGPMLFMSPDATEEEVAAAIADFRARKSA